MEFLAFMAAPIVMCLVLVGIHVHLGLHVVRRGVIFVDIAMAQASALGAAIGVALGAEVGTLGSWLAGLALALLAAALISRTRRLHQRVPQEAFIGITFAVAAAATLLVLDRVPHGGESVDQLLVGSILWVTWGQVVKSALLYSALGLLLFAVRKPVERITADPAGAERDGLRTTWWDFVFYAVVGIAVTQSVPVAGVFLVFTFLVVPAVMALLVSARHALLVGWVLGSGTAILGAAVSYGADLPTGATIVCLFGLELGVLTLFLGKPAAPAR